MSGQYDPIQTEVECYLGPYLTTEGADDCSVLRDDPDRLHNLCGSPVRIRHSMPPNARCASDGSIMHIDFMGIS